MNGPGASLPFLFGPYELLVRLGHGGMGQVYLARRATVAGSDSLCVVKTLKPELAEDGEYVGRFLDEVRTVMQLRHSSISHVFDAGQHAGTYYMAMEHLSGVTGRELWTAARTGHLDVGLALLVVEDVLGALAYAHGFTNPLTGAPLSVVHRDVSPHNVIVTFEGEVKLIDFGLAESVLKQEHTESQVVMGKISYMSPEQARGEDVDGACDQFAAAVMLYELASGERFYGARNNSEIWTVVGYGGFRPDRFAELPPELAAILERALAADPRERFPDCRAFQAALEALHAKSHPHATRSRLRSFMQEAFAEQRRKQQQDLVRAATLSAEVQQHTQSQSVSRPSAPSSGVWLSSPTPPLADGSPPHVETEALPRAEPSESLRVPRSRAPLAIAAGAAVVVVLGLGAALALGETDAVTSRATPSAAPGSEPAARTSPPPPTIRDAVATRAQTRDASEDERGATLEGKPRAATGSDDSDERVRQRRQRSAKRAAAGPPDEPREGVGAPREDDDTAGHGAAAAVGSRDDDDDDGDDTKPKAPALASPEGEPLNAPAPMSNADALAVVKACDLGCASRILALPGVKDGSVLGQKPNAVVLNCARRCLAR